LQWRWVKEATVQLNERLNELLPSPYRTSQKTSTAPTRPSAKDAWPEALIYRRTGTGSGLGLLDRINFLMKKLEFRYARRARPSLRQLRYGCWTILVLVLVHTYLSSGI
jgi:hypothetical protein